MLETQNCNVKMGAVEHGAFTRLFLFVFTPELFALWEEKVYSCCERKKLTVSLWVWQRLRYSPALHGAFTAHARSLMPRALRWPCPDPRLAFARRSALSMGRGFACAGPPEQPPNLAPVWSWSACLCVWSTQAPRSSVRGLLTACSATRAVYFSSVCTNPALITRFLQLGQIRPRDPAHSRAPTNQVEEAVIRNVRGY